MGSRKRPCGSGTPTSPKIIPVDALFRLRVLIWIMVLSLWGVMVYQFLGEEEEAPAMSYVANPYKAAAPPLPQPPEGPPPEAAPPPPESPPPLPDPPVAPPETAAAAKMEFIKPIAPKYSQPSGAPRTGRRAPLRREAAVTLQDPPIPAGFIKTPTRHFNIYSEGSPPSEEFIALLENIHGNLMLDLAAFSPWAREEKVALFLFKNQDTYRKVTGRPPWSGGASSVPKRKVYIYESEELTGILAHELCHIYYDGFFLGGKNNPLWLSEGMATLVQVERGLAAPNWLRENLETLRSGGGYSLQDLMRVNSTSGASDDNVRLWYTQSYSMVRYLLRIQYKSSFYNFSRNLRDGKPLSESLYRAYGMPFTNLKALEHAWRFDTSNKSR